MATNLKVYESGQWVLKKNLSQVAWADVTDKPTTFTPTSHNHAITNITGLIEGSSFSGEYPLMHYVGTNNRIYTHTGLTYVGSTGVLKVATDVQAGGQALVKTNDARLSNSRPASDVYSWAKASVKPSYNASEIGGLGASYRWLTDTYISTWNSKEPAITKGTTAQYFRGDMTLATMPTTLPASDVYSWAKASTKPTYNQDEVGDGTTYKRVTQTEKNTWNAKTTLALGETSVTAYRGDRGKTAYDHSLLTHAPSNAQKNSDITKTEIEAKLTGAITSHTHAYEPANANIQTHVTSAHAPSNAQKNSDITKTEIEAKLTGAITSHTHAYEPAITKGTTSQYFRGDMTLATMPTTLPASDVYSWAKASTKPSYTAADIGAAPTSHASTETTYGAGSTTNYGHVKTINTLTQSAHLNGNALSAYQGKVLKDMIDNIHPPVSGFTKCFTISATDVSAAEYTEYANVNGYKDIIIVYNTSASGYPASGSQWIYANTTVILSGTFPEFANGVFEISQEWWFFYWDYTGQTGKYLSVWGR